jgi:hypothetical protein
VIDTHGKKGGGKILTRHHTGYKRIMFMSDIKAIVLGGQLTQDHEAIHHKDTQRRTIPCDNVYIIVNYHFRTVLNGPQGFVS